MADLPVKAIEADLLSTIVSRDCILSAPPGAGKSTYLMLQLLKLGAFKSKQILLTQPRQVAVRNIAHYLAQQLNEKVGNTVGYQMRSESVVSKSTRLCVITEGLLIAKLQQDPELNDTALVVFDEFHERSLSSDIGLGLCLDVQAGLREDLRILLMSATLDVGQIRQLMPNAKYLSSLGRSFPIEYIYRPLKNQRSHALSQRRNKSDHFLAHVQSVIIEALNQQEGNILVFLPGARPINQLLAKLNQMQLNDVLIFALYGGLSNALQNKAIETPVNAQRKIVLATNIAETSLTINGVNIVIDSGREKVQKLNLARKTNQLLEQMISKASSIQRAGRAGRQGPGICYRLFSEQQQAFLNEQTEAQILQQDISQTLLTLKEWGCEFKDLRLVNYPSQAQIDYALSQLHMLGLLNSHNNITALGKIAAKFNTSVRLALLLANAVDKNVSNQYKYLMAAIASVLENPRHQQQYGGTDFYPLLKTILQNDLHARSAYGALPISQINKSINRWYKRLQASNSITKLTLTDEYQTDVIEAVLRAYPDKLARKRSNNTYILRDGTGAEFLTKAHEPITQDKQPDWIICLDVQIGSIVDTSANAKIQQYCEVPQNIVEPYLASHVSTNIQQTWDHKLAKVVCIEKLSLGSITLQTKPCELQFDETTQRIICEQIANRGLKPLLGKAKLLLARINFAANMDSIYAPKFRNLSIDKLQSNLDSWLMPYLNGVFSWQKVEKLDWFNIIKAMLSWEEQQFLDSYCPTHYKSPTGNSHLLNYTNHSSVEMSIRLQELYGLQTHPSIGLSGFPITLSILSPANREIQKTTDLIGFWQGSYGAVQKDMKGRYPKHFWPDDPAHAKATTKTKKHM